MTMSTADRRAAMASPLLRGLNPDRVARLLTGAVLQRVPKGTVVIEEGSIPDCLYLLIDGNVEAFTAGTGRDHSLMIFSATDIFMPAAAIVDQPHIVSVRALKKSKLLLIPAETVRQEMAQCPIFACRLATLLAGQLRLALRHIKDIKTRTGPQRLAAYLLRLIDETGEAGSAELPFSKGMLASRLGMTAETMSRSLQLVADKGLTVRGHRVLLKNREKVEHFCKPNPSIDSGEAGLDVSAW